MKPHQIRGPSPQPRGVDDVGGHTRVGTLGPLRMLPSAPATPACSLVLTPSFGRDHHPQRNLPRLSATEARAAGLWPALIFSAALRHRLLPCLHAAASSADLAWPGRGVRARRSEGNVNCRNLGPRPWLRRTWSKIFTVGHPHP